MSVLRNIRPWAGQLLGHALALGHGSQGHFGGQIPLVATASCTRFRQRSSVASVNLPPAKTGRAASQDERREFISVFPDMVRDLSEIGTHSDIPEAQKWYAKILQYNAVGGKMNRGLAVGLSYKLLAKPEDITADSMRRAHILGWCIELLQSFFLVADDIIDGSEMRRGRPAWYRKDDLGLSAFNDAILLEAGIYKLLHQHFRDEPYYVDVLELFHEMTLKTALGQCLDLMSCPAGGRPVLSKFTMERYDAIVKYKTAYYSFYLPVALAMYMAGIRNTDTVRVADITDRELHRQARTILVEMGHFFQVQDDYLDCFGDPSVTGKVGTDIAEGKCTWLSVVALQRATPAQRALMEQHYGNPEEESVNKVRALYKELGLPATYRAYEDSTSSMIRVHIQQISRGLNHNVFFKFLDKIHKRSS
ncbi:farnesyl pyrophosphate synthase-like [Penaeus chinensis]|uniref:farnesyl pyrophosphate synthase-like n=1 Tax=Penaeus chinensis TaxID=139456 RepID=UPI001FB75908|nr:farnesyl pyrophosphate synthase-like [Penaeus chinensis]